MDEKQKYKNEAEETLKELKKSFSECKAGESEARKNNTSASKCYITNHVESVILK